MNERINLLLLKYINREIDSDELFELKEWIDHDEVNRKWMVKFLSAYKNSRQIDFLQQASKEEMWSSFCGKRLKRKKIHLWKQMAYAASIVVMVGLSGVLYLQLHPQQPAGMVAWVQQKQQTILTLSDGERVELGGGKQMIENNGKTVIKDSSGHLSYLKETNSDRSIHYNEIFVPRGGCYSLTLADGTNVWLNSDTKLRYPLSFSGNLREVELEGEAYFEVARNEEKPFVVNISDHKIRVLGTHFNISAYRDMDHIYTTLLEGSVKVESPSEEKIILPNEQADMVRGQGKIMVNQVDAGFYTSWLTGVFEFRDASLEDILKQLTRWYDVDIEYTTDVLKEKKFAGVIKKEKSLEFTMKMIEKISNLTFIQNGKTIKVSDK